MSLQVWLPLTGDLHNQGLNGELAIINNGVTVASGGKISNQCYYFNSKTLILPSYSTTRSICFWLKATKTNSTIAFVDYKSQLGFGFQSNGHIIPNTAGSSNIKMYSSDNFKSGEWNHVALIRDDAFTDVQLYLNGVLQTTRLSTNTWTNTVDGCYLGGRSTGTYMTCYINDFRVYDHALSDKEVEEIAKGLVLHYKLNNSNIGNENLLLNSLTPTSGNGATGVVKSIENGIQKVVADNPNNNWITFANHNTTLALAKGDSFTFSLMIKSPDSDKKPTVYFQSGMGYFSMQGTMSPDWSIIYYTGIWNIDNLVTNIHLGFSSAPGTYYIRYFKLEKGTTYTSWAPNHNDQEWSEYGCDNNIIYDSSGYENNGVITGDIQINESTPRYSCSMKQTSGQYIRVEKHPAECLPKDKMTVNFWMYCTTWGNPVSCTEGGGWNFENGSTGIRFPVYISGVGYKYQDTTVTTSSLLNAWHMLTGVFDGSNVLTYIDGELKTSISTGSTNGIGYANNYLFIGAEASGNSTSPANSPYTGSLSDFRIYATALTAEQIKELYHTSATIDNNGNIYARELVEE